MSAEHQKPKSRQKPNARQKPACMRNKAWVPDQHGAWGMLIIPLIVGSFLGSPKVSHLLLAFVAIVGFLAFHALSLWWKSRKQKRFQKPCLVYSLLFLISALSLVLWHPRLLHWWWVVAPFALIAAWRAWVKDERSLLARTSIILVACQLIPIGYDLGIDFAHPFTDLSVHSGQQLTSWWPGGALHTPLGWAWVWICTGMFALYFVGTVPFVKTMIRKRNSRSWLWGSIAYHAVALILVAFLASWGWVSWLLVVVWVILLARAAGFPGWMHSTGKPVRPALIGMTEIVTSILVLATATA